MIVSSSDDPGVYTLLALDIRAQREDRIRAIATLGQFATTTAAEALLELGGRNDENPEILQAAGTALGALAHLGVRITEFDLRDLERAAYEAYCSWQE